MGFPIIAFNRNNAGKKMTTTSQIQLISTKDEQAIRRSVWSSFVRTGKAHCPFPVGHAHRAIWVDEQTAIAREFADQILPPAPQSTVITLYQFQKELSFVNCMEVFGALPMGETLEGEVIPLPSAPEPEEEIDHQEAARLGHQLYVHA